MPLMLVIILADSLRIFMPMLHTYNEKDLTRCEDVFLKHIAQTPYPARVLAPVLFSNMPMLHGYASASGYSGNTLGRFNTFVNTVTQSPPDRLQALNPIKGYTEAPVFRFLAYDFAILEKEELPQNYEVLEAADPFYLIPYPKPFPRAYLAAAPVAAGSEADALAYVCAGTNNLHQSPVAEQADLGGVAAAPPGADEDVRFIDFKPNRVELEARAARRRVLVLGEAYEKNWTATINGQRAAVFPVNYLFRGVVVPEGTSRVVFDYRPASFRWGATVSGVSLILLVGLLRMGVRRKRGTRSAEHGKFRNVECGMGNEEAIDKNALHKEPQRTRKGPQRGNTRRGIR